MIDFVGIAEGLAKDFYATSFGVLVDFSPASLVTLDAFLDETWGLDGKKSEPGWKLSEGQGNMVMLYGSYCGEVIRRRCGGQWNMNTGQSATEATVTLTKVSWHLLPIAKAYKRLQNGPEDALHLMFQLARSKQPAVGAEQATEVAEYEAHAVHFLANSALPVDARAPIAARLRAHVPVKPTAGAALAPGTMLSECPACHRPAPHGKIACMYCGGSLVVPASCGKCGRKNGPKAKACMYCRAPL